MNTKPWERIRVAVIDIGIVVAIFMGLEFARTESEPVTDWIVWGRALGLAGLRIAVAEVVKRLITRRPA